MLFCKVHISHYIYPLYYIDQASKSLDLCFYLSHLEHSALSNAKNCDTMSILGSAASHEQEEESLLIGKVHLFPKFTATNFF